MRLLFNTIFNLIVPLLWCNTEIEWIKLMQRNNNNHGIKMLCIVYGVHFEIINVRLIQDILDFYIIKPEKWRAIFKIYDENTKPICNDLHWVEKKHLHARKKRKFQFFFGNIHFICAHLKKIVSQDKQQAHAKADKMQFFHEIHLLRARKIDYCIKYEILYKSVAKVLLLLVVHFLFCCVCVRFFFIFLLWIAFFLSMHFHFSHFNHFALSVILLLLLMLFVANIFRF